MYLTHVQSRVVRPIRALQTPHSEESICMTIKGFPVLSVDGIFA